MQIISLTPRHKYLSVRAHRRKTCGGPQQALLTIDPFVRLGFETWIYVQFIIFMPNTFLYPKF